MSAKPRVLLCGFLAAVLFLLPAAAHGNTPPKTSPAPPPVTTSTPLVPIYFHDIKPHLSWPDLVLPASFCFFTVLLVSFPIVRYLFRPWTFRRDKLISQLSGESMVLYYQQFRSAEQVTAKSVLQRRQPWYAGRFGIPLKNDDLFKARIIPPVHPIAETTQVSSVAPDGTTTVTIVSPGAHAGIAAPPPSRNESCSSDTKPIPPEVIELYDATFRLDFDKWYGLRYYIIPVIVLAILCAVCAWWCTFNLWIWLSTAGLGPLETQRALATSALAGAFVWIISDEIDRLRRRDFTTSDVYYYIFRILLSIPFAWALASLDLGIVKGVPIAFFLGAFPTTTLFTGARRIVNKYTQLGDDPDSGKLEIEKLQSVGKEIAERYKDEGVSSICQLAYADPVDLTIRTNFDFSYVCATIAQALLWLYLNEDQIKAVSIFSLRSSYEVRSLWADLHNKDAKIKADADATLKAIVAALQPPAAPQQPNPTITPESLSAMLYQVACDPYTIFLVNIWK
jgi:hypothetical protein